MTTLQVSLPLTMMTMKKVVEMRRMRSWKSKISILMRRS